MVSETLTWKSAGLTLFYTGLFNPFIGLSFAQLLYFFSLSGLISVPVVQENPASATGVVMAMSFPAGFSERLVKDLIQRTESKGHCRRMPPSVVHTGHSGIQNRWPATRDNDWCGVGIAFRAGIGGVRLLDGRVTDAAEGASLSV